MSIPVFHPALEQQARRMLDHRLQLVPVGRRCPSCREPAGQVDPGTAHFLARITALNLFLNVWRSYWRNLAAWTCNRSCRCDGKVQQVVAGHLCLTVWEYEVDFDSDWRTEEGRGDG